MTRFHELESKFGDDNLYKEYLEEDGEDMYPIFGTAVDNIERVRESLGADDDKIKWFDEKLEWFESLNTESKCKIAGELGGIDSFFIVLIHRIVRFEGTTYFPDKDCVKIFETLIKMGAKSYNSSIVRNHLNTPIFETGEEFLNYLVMELVSST